METLVKYTALDISKDLIPYEYPLLYTMPAVNEPTLLIIMVPAYAYVVNTNMQQILYDLCPTSFKTTLVRFYDSIECRQYTWEQDICNDMVTFCNYVFTICNANIGLTYADAVLVKGCTSQICRHKLELYTVAQLLLLHENTIPCDIGNPIIYTSSTMCVGLKRIGSFSFTLQNIPSNDIDHTIIFIIPTGLFLSSPEIQDLYTKASNKIPAMYTHRIIRFYACNDDWAPAAYESAKLLLQYYIDHYEFNTEHNIYYIDANMSHDIYSAALYLDTHH